MLRAIAGVLGFLLPLAGIVLALLFSGVGPLSQVFPVFASECGVLGLLLGLGFLAFGFLPRHKLTQSPVGRSLWILGLGAPFIVRYIVTFLRLGR